MPWVVCVESFGGGGALLRLHEGDIVNATASAAGQEWLYGVSNGSRGRFPRSKASAVDASTADLAVATFDWQPPASEAPASAQYIPLIKGGVVQVAETLKSGWCKGSCNGRQGMFPANFIKTLPRTWSLAVAVFAYSNADPAHLKLPRGATVCVISTDPTGWCVGVHNGYKGVFPSNFVRVIPPPQPDPIEPPSEAAAGGELGSDTSQDEEDQRSSRSPSPSPPPTPTPGRLPRDKKKRPESFLAFLETGSTSEDGSSETARRTPVPAASVPVLASASVSVSESVTASADSVLTSSPPVVPHLKLPPRVVSDSEPPTATTATSGGGGSGSESESTAASESARSTVTESARSVSVPQSAVSMPKRRRSGGGRHSDDGASVCITPLPREKNEPQFGGMGKLEDLQVAFDIESKARCRLQERARQYEVKIAQMQSKLFAERERREQSEEACVKMSSELQVPCVQRYGGIDT
eukprot:TRINITY_DN3573_c0_g1_i2.p1 TRINITY_DN3573_c0_g1~~TRINITY_DN3573_c0_g1_i2.p1  ORF type:complete len:478 (-),score=97.82 TRINITY_DN3573_c0_g1_i2:1368-2771(-)